MIMTTHHILLEGVEELDDVCRGADVDEQELGELIVGQLALRQQPTAQDQQQQQHLLQGLDPLLRLQPQRDADLQVDLHG